MLLYFRTEDGDLYEYFMGDVFRIFEGYTDTRCHIPNWQNDEYILEGFRKAYNQIK